MAGGALAAAPEDVPAVVLPCGLDWLPAGSCQGFDAGPSGTVLVRGRSQHYLIVLASVSANRNLTHHDETGHNERAPRSPGGAPTSQHFHGRGCSNEHAQHERFGGSGVDDTDPAGMPVSGSVPDRVASSAGPQDPPAAAAFVIGRRGLGFAERVRNPASPLVRTDVDRRGTRGWRSVLLQWLPGAWRRGGRRRIENRPGAPPVGSVGTANAGPA